MNNAVLVIILFLLLAMCACMAFFLFVLAKRQMSLEKKTLQANSQKDLIQKEQSMAALQQVSDRLDAISASSVKNSAMMNNLSRKVEDMTSVMSNAKKRGTFGEYQMESLIRTYLGNSPEIFETQYSLNNGKIADGIFHLPSTDKLLCIDSKFPMENYLAMVSEPESAGFYEKELRRNIKKHIQDVSDKYITEQTLDTAALFIPSEGIYQYLCGEGADLMNYAMSRHVMLVSPTTLCGVIFSLLSFTRDFTRMENMAAIEKNLAGLEKEMDTLAAQSQKVQKSSALLAQNLSVLENTVSKLRLKMDAALNSAVKEENSHGSAQENPDIFEAGFPKRG